MARLSMRSRAEALAIVRSDLGECTRCKLHKGRIKLVFGAGNAEARLMFVGEGPGAEEDEQGVPFVGRAGQLLTQIIKAMGLEREDVYIANVVKCRPPGNRNPEPDEIEQCEPFLMRQMDVIKPAVVVALGKFAAQTLLRTAEPISRIRGRFHQVGDTRVMPTFHPSYLLRNPAAKRDVWEDMKAVMGVLREDGPSHVMHDAECTMHTLPTPSRVMVIALRVCALPSAGMLRSGLLHCALCILHRAF